MNDQYKVSKRDQPSCFPTACPNRVIPRARLNNKGNVNQRPTQNCLRKVTVRPVKSKEDYSRTGCFADSCRGRKRLSASDLLVGVWRFDRSFTVVGETPPLG